MVVCPMSTHYWILVSYGVRNCPVIQGGDAFGFGLIVIVIRVG